MSDCNHDCSACGTDCEDRKAPQSFQVPMHERSSVKKVIGVASGKGGVGKSLVTALLAIGMQKRGKQSGVLDGDLTGPSIPKILGVTERAQGVEDGLLPCKSSTGIDVISMNLLLDNPSDPVVWRGPVIGNVVKQFWSEVIWEQEKFLFVDMPPGTGDVPLTVYQSLPLDGIIIVTSPQELVSMIVGKAIRMAEIMKVPVLGLVENMSYVECPDCKRPIHVFGESHLEDFAKEHDLPVLGRIPLNPDIAQACDAGALECLKQNYLEPAFELLDKLEEKEK